MILINGQENSLIEVADRGLQYGDGLFETIEVIQGRPVFFKQHIYRLNQGCSRLKLPLTDFNLLAQEVERVCHNSAHAVVKIIITRGTGGRGYSPPDLSQPTRIISLYPFPDYPVAFWQHGVAAIFCTTRLGLNPALAGIKHLNRLEQVMARAEMSGLDVQEGIMLDHYGHVVEGTMTNLFYVKGMVVYTAPIRLTGIAGIMRGIILELLAQMGIAVNEREYGKDELLNADECFFCNSVIGIWPVRQIDGTPFSKGRITCRLQEGINQLKTEEPNRA